MIVGVPMLTRGRLEQETEWRLLLEDPLSVYPHMLSTMLKLQVSDPNSAPVSETSSLFYIREFHVKVQDLKQIFRSMLHDGYDMNPRIFIWMERIEDQNVADSSYLTLRYCGQTKNSPWDRHVSDMYSTSLRSFLGQFYRTAGFACPWVLPEAKVWLVVDASSAAPVAQQHIDLQEQVLIALFGDCVLNTEHGGKDIITMTEDDQEVFASLNTTTIKELTRTKPCPPIMLQNLRDYAKNVRVYVQHNPTTLKGKTTHKFSQATEKMIVQQGAPCVLPDGSAVMVSVGSDLGDTHDDEESTFFEAGGRSADVVTTVYNHLYHWEQGLSASFDDLSTKNLAKAGQLPFADLFPWFVKHNNDYSDASRLLGQYMNITKPYLVLSYGNLPTFAAARNFTAFTSANYETEMSRDRRANGAAYWVRSVMGVPQLLAFNSNVGSTVGKEFILIPCYHPGMTGHAGIMKEKLTRLLVMVSSLAWDAMGRAIYQSRQGGGLSRKQKCEQILSYLRFKLNPSHAFGQSMTRAKADYVIAITADAQGRIARKANLSLGKPSRGILPSKTRAARKSRLDQNVQTISGVGGYEVDIHALVGTVSASEKTRYRLRWAEDNGEAWSVEPVIFPDNVIPNDTTDKRFVF
jgi:hypothetical protein